MIAGYASLFRQAAVIARDLRALRQRDATEAQPMRAAGDVARALNLTLDPWQAEIATPPRRPTLVLVSRQGGKGVAATVLALATMLGDPGSKVLTISRSERQARRLHRRIRRAYHRLPHVPPAVSDTAAELELRNGSIAVALPGSEATIRGEDAVDLAIIDEASRVPDDLYRAVRPMLATTNGVVIGLTTPFGKWGWFYEEWTNGGDEWQRIKVTAEQIPRISPAFLAAERRALGEQWFAQEYGCAFLDNEWQLFPTDLILAAADDALAPLFDQPAVELDPDGADDDLAPLFAEVVL